MGGPLISVYLYLQQMQGEYCSTVVSIVAQT